PPGPPSSPPPPGPQPTGPSRTPATPSFGGGPNVVPPPPSDLSQTPVFTPFEVRPRLRNAADFGSRLDQSYPPMLRDAGIGGTVTMWVFIDREGRVANTRLVQSSGYDQLDRVAEQMMRDVAEFS